MTLVNFLMTVVLPTFVGAGSAWLCVKFLAERLLTHRLSKDLERFKTELSERTDVLKTQLAIFSHEQNVANSRVDTQRANAIHTIYGCMRTIINPLSSIAAGVPIVDGTTDQLIDYYFGNGEEAHAACGNLANRLADFAIYFDNETYKEIAAFAKTAMDATAAYLHQLRKRKAEGATSAELLSLAEAERTNLRKSLVESVRPQAMRLAGIFRAQLGVDK